MDHAWTGELVAGRCIAAQHVSVQVLRRTSMHGCPLEHHVVEGRWVHQVTLCFEKFASDGADPPPEGRAWCIAVLLTWQLAVWARR